jgi:hypothetical protein
VRNIIDKILNSSIEPPFLNNIKPFGLTPEEEEEIILEITGGSIILERSAGGIIVVNEKGYTMYAEQPNLFWEIYDYSEDGDVIYFETPRGKIGKRIMKESIKRILKEYREDKITSFEKRALKLIHNKGYSPSDKEGIIQFLSNELFISGFDVIELYNLYKDYYDKQGNYDDLDVVSKIEPQDLKTVRTANIRARDLVKSKRTI